MIANAFGRRRHRTCDHPAQAAALVHRDRGDGPFRGRDRVESLSFERGDHALMISDSEGETKFELGLSRVIAPAE
jgi:hypothetical protein